MLSLQDTFITIKRIWIEFKMLITSMNLCTFKKYPSPINISNWIKSSFFNDRLILRKLQSTKALQHLMPCHMSTVKEQKKGEQKTKPLVGEFLILTIPKIKSLKNRALNVPLKMSNLTRVDETEKDRRILKITLKEVMEIIF